MADADVESSKHRCAPVNARECKQWGKPIPVYNDGIMFSYKRICRRKNPKCQRNNKWNGRFEKPYHREKIPPAIDRVLAEQKSSPKATGHGERLQIIEIGFWKHLPVVKRSNRLLE